MNYETLLTKLQETAEKLSIKVDYDDLRKGVINTPGGSFVLRGEKRILVHKHLTDEEKVDILTEILAKQDTEGVFMAPEVREVLQAERSAS